MPLRSRSSRLRWGGSKCPPARTCKGRESNPLRIRRRFRRTAHTLGSRSASMTHPAGSKSRDRVRREDGCATLLPESLSAGSPPARLARPGGRGDRKCNGRRRRRPRASIARVPHHGDARTDRRSRRTDPRGHRTRSAVPFEASMLLRAG